MKSIQISNVRVLGNSGNVILEFAGLGKEQVGFKPLSVVTARLEPTHRAIVSLTPSMLIGAKLSVEDSDYNGVQTKGAIVPFKKGDKYVANANSSKVKSGEAVVGQELTCEGDGLRIEGNINIALHPSVIAKINDKAMEIVLTRRDAMLSTPAIAVASASANANDDNPLHDEPTMTEDVKGNATA